MFFSFSASRWRHDVTVGTFAAVRAMMCGFLSGNPRFGARLQRRRSFFALETLESGDAIGRATDLRFTGRGFEFWLGTIA